MHHYPINLNLNGKKCVLIGGGAVAERKAKTMVAAGGEVLVISPELTAGLIALAEKETLVWVNRAYQAGDLDGFFLAVCATDDEAVNLLAAQEAKEKKILVDIVDKPLAADFTVPAQVRRGNLLLTVSTGGQSPALAREIKKELAALYGEEYGVYLELIAQMRLDLKKTLSDSKEREKFWQRALDEEILLFLRQGKIAEAKKILAGRMKECD
jgi:precorrin-2 dehydrogenase/sirohydrochlorin ferrochelatase